MTTLEIKPGEWAVLRNGEVRGPLEYTESRLWCWKAEDGSTWQASGAYDLGLMDDPLDIIATLPAPSMETIAGLKAEIERLTKVNADLSNDLDRAEEEGCDVDTLIIEADKKQQALQAEIDRLRLELILPEADRRQSYIFRCLQGPGWFNRKDICANYGVSMQQASADIQRFLAENPKAATYNTSSKRYEKTMIGGAA